MRSGPPIVRGHPLLCLPGRSRAAQGGRIATRQPHTRWSRSRQNPRLCCFRPPRKQQRQGFCCRVQAEEHGAASVGRRGRPTWSILARRHRLVRRWRRASWHFSTAVSPSTRSIAGPRSGRRRGGRSPFSVASTCGARRTARTRTTTGRYGDGCARSGIGWISRGRSSGRWCRRSGRRGGSSGGNRRPEPHGQGSLPPSFSTSSLPPRTTRWPRLTWVSLEGTPGGACWSAQKDASASRSRCMAASFVRLAHSREG